MGPTNAYILGILTLPVLGLAATYVYMAVDAVQSWLARRGLHFNRTVSCDRCGWTYTGKRRRELRLKASDHARFLCKHRKDKKNDE